MNKNAKLSAVLFALLFLLQAFILRYLMLNVAVTGVAVAMLAEVVALAMFARCAIRAKTGAYTECCAKQTLAAGSIFYAVFLLIYNTMELSLIASGVALFNETLATNNTVLIAVFVVKLVLLAAAVFFAVAPEKECKAEVEFEEAPAPETLLAPEAVEKLNEQLDEKEV